MKIDNYVYENDDVESKEKVTLFRYKLHKSDIQKILDMLQDDAPSSIFVYPKNDEGSVVLQRQTFVRAEIVEVLNAHVEHLSPLNHYCLNLTFQNNKGDRFNLLAWIDRERIAFYDN